MSDAILQASRQGRVAVIRLDDGKANALSPAMIGAIGAALDEAEKDAGAVLLVGCEGRFSGGFDLATMRSGPEEAAGMVLAGAELLIRLFEFPLPVVVACNGHAMAAGALLVLACDQRLAARGDFRIGLNEVTIGMTLPVFALELARARLSKRHFDQATSQARLYGRDEALDAGYFDRLTEPGELFDVALAEAERLSTLQQPAFGASKARAHAATLATIRASLKEDRGRLGAG